MLDWEGHPYYYRRDRSKPYRIVNVEPVYKSVLSGYAVKENKNEN